MLRGRCCWSCCCTIRLPRPLGGRALVSESVCGAALAVLAGGRTSPPLAWTDGMGVTGFTAACIWCGRLIPVEGLAVLTEPTGGGGSWLGCGAVLNMNVVDPAGGCCLDFLALCIAQMHTQYQINWKMRQTAQPKPIPMPSPASNVSPRDRSPLLPEPKMCRWNSIRSTCVCNYYIYIILFTRNKYQKQCSGLGEY